ncbi:MAG: hypothetical protein ABIH82_06440, partial [Candidatus Woesearchaeota archaeon]
MVNVPQINFLSAEGGLLFETHKLRRLDARFKTAEKALKKCTLEKLKALNYGVLHGQIDKKELNVFLGVFQTNYVNLIKAYLDVIREISRIFGLVAQSEYEDLMSLDEILKELETAVRAHSDWFVYDQDLLTDFQTAFFEKIDDMKTKLVDEYSLKRTVGAHGNSKLLRLRAFLKSRGIIERYAERKATQVGRVYRQAKKKETKIKEKIAAGDFFLPLMREYVDLWDDLNQLLHIIVLDVLTVFGRFASEIGPLLAYYDAIINKIPDGTIKTNLRTRHDSFSAEFVALENEIESDKWANINNTIGQNIDTKAKELMDYLFARGTQGPKTRA